MPRDEGFLEGFRRGSYAVDADGRYTLVATPGWEAETAATTVALEEQDRLVRDCWEQCGVGLRSPLAYHMVRRQMTPKLLSANSGVGRLRVAWHLRPAGFARLGRRTLLRYAAALNVPPDELITLPEAPESLL